jgi:hypothetical protein
LSDTVLNSTLVSLLTSLAGALMENKGEFSLVGS